MCKHTEPEDEQLKDLDLIEAVLLNTQEVHSLRYEMCILAKILERIALQLER